MSPFEGQLLSDLKSSPKIVPMNNGVWFPYTSKLYDEALWLLSLLGQHCSWECDFVLEWFVWN